MRTRPPAVLYWFFVLVAVLSLVAGTALIAAPGLARLLLAVPPPEVDPPLRVFMGVTGYFILLLGAAFLHALLSRDDHPLLIFYVIWEKFGAALAVAVGIMAGVLASFLWLLVAYDVLSGVLIAWYRQHLHRTPRPGPALV